MDIKIIYFGGFLIMVSRDKIVEAVEYFFMDVIQNYKELEK